VVCGKESFAAIVEVLVNILLLLAFLIHIVGVFLLVRVVLVLLVGVYFV